MKKYYGIRFLGGNRTCTTGQPNKTTRRYSIAVDVAAFNSTSDRETWLRNEKRHEPTGLGGGERMPVKRADIRKYLRGMSMEDFRSHLAYISNATDF